MSGEPGRKRVRQFVAQLRAVKMSEAMRTDPNRGGHHASLVAKVQALDDVARYMDSGAYPGDAPQSVMEAALTDGCLR